MVFLVRKLNGQKLSLFGFPGVNFPDNTFDIYELTKPSMLNNDLA